MEQARKTLVWRRGSVGEVGKLVMNERTRYVTAHHVATHQQHQRLALTNIRTCGEMN